MIAISFTTDGSDPVRCHECHRTGAECRRGFILNNGPPASWLHEDGPRTRKVFLCNFCVSRMNATSDASHAAEKGS